MIANAPPPSYASTAPDVLVWRSPLDNFSPNEITELIDRMQVELSRACEMPLDILFGRAPSST